MNLPREMVGVHIPSHILGFISSMPGVGAAFSAPFSAIAVVALLAALDYAGERTLEIAVRRTIFRHVRMIAF